MNHYKKLLATVTVVAQILLVGAFGTLSFANAQEASDVTSDPIVTTDTTTTDTNVVTPTDATPVSDITTTAPDTTVSDTMTAVNAETAPVETPVLTTDKADYAPGETSTIFGKFFGAFKMIVLKVFGYDEIGGSYTENIQNVSTDSEGSFTTTYTLENIFRPLYTVVANTIDGDPLARTTFTDGNIKVHAAPTGTTFTLTKTIYNSTNCSGTISSGPTAVTSVGVSGDTTGVGNTKSAKFQAAANSDQGGTFTNWTTTDLVVTNIGDTLCVVGFTGGGTRDYNANYGAPVKLNQTITVNTPAPGTESYGSVFSIAATASSGLPVAITSEGSCSGSGTGSATITMTSGSGSCAVHYNQAGNGAYNSAPEVTSSTTALLKSASVAPDSAFKVYGEADPLFTGTLTGFLPADLVTAVYSRTAGETVAGSPYVISAVLAPSAVLGNYAVTYNTADFTINKAPSITSVVCPVSVTYNGSAQTPCTVSVTGAGGLSLAPEPIYTDNTNAGTASASYTYAGDENHNGSSDSKNFEILALSLTGSFTADNKTYDGNTSATILTRSLSGVIFPDVVTLDGGTATFDNANAGTWKTVTLVGATLGGADAGNYTLDSVGTTTADITPLALTPSIVANDKVYDGTVSATISSRSLAAVVNLDDVSLVAGVATFDAANVGTHTVTETGLTLTGAQAGNYSLTSDSATDTAEILGYNFIACYQPLTLNSKDFKKTSTIPVKCAYTNYNPNAKIRLFVDLDPAKASGSSNTDNLFRYSPTDKFWIFNLSTKQIAAPKTYTLGIVADDGSPKITQTITVR